MAHAFDPKDYNFSNAPQYRREDGRVRKALRVDRDTQVGDVLVEKGGVVVQADASVEGISEAAFMRDYARADEKGKVFVALTEPLEVQLKAASHAGQWTHRADIVARLQMMENGAPMVSL